MKGTVRKKSPSVWDQIDKEDLNLWSSDWRPPTEQEMESISKPPIGLTPQWLHEEHRIEEIEAAIERYTAAGTTIPLEWRSELNDLLASKMQRSLAKHLRPYFCITSTPRTLEDQQDLMGRMAGVRSAHVSQSDGDDIGYHPMCFFYPVAPHMV